MMGDDAGAKILLPYWLIIGACVITMSMAMLSGFTPCAACGYIEPVTLLRLIAPLARSTDLATPQAAIDRKRSCRFSGGSQWGFA